MSGQVNLTEVISGTILPRDDRGPECLASTLPQPRPGGEPSTAKTIVLTGAMVPYAFGSSDGLFNLGSALSFVQALPAGVYVAMNGRAFAWNDVRKNRTTGMFENLEP